MKTLVFVGCNSSDDVVRLAKRHDRSILFEPLPEAALELSHKLGGTKGATVYQMACGQFGEVKTLNVYNVNGLSSSLGRVTQEAISRFSKFDLSLRNSVEVIVVNLYEFLRYRQIDEIETLVIDAQGMDLAILKTMRPMLENSKVGSVQVEADGEGFRHYDGLPDNTVSGHLEFMASFHQYQQVPTKTVAFHPDLKWELQNDCSFVETVERMACRSYF